MSNRRRIFLVFISLSIGMGLSVLLFIKKNNGKPLDSNDYLWLGTNLFFSLLIIGGVVYYFSKKDQNNLKK